MTDIDEIVTMHQRFMETVFSQSGKFVAQGVLYIRPSVLMKVGAERGVFAPCSVDDLPNDDPMPMPFKLDDEPPHVLASFMRSVAEKTTPTVAVIMVEAWMAQATDDDVTADRRASEMPNREEVLMLTVETDDGRTRAHVAKIVRDAAGRGTVSPWRETARNGIAGRMVGILPPTNPQ